jgi:hypothetical protein
VRIVLGFLYHRKGDNNCEGGSNIKEGIILFSVKLLRRSTEVIRASQAVFNVFNSPWKRITPIKTATTWSFVGAYAKSVFKETAASIISAKTLDIEKFESPNRRRNLWMLWLPLVPRG